MSCKLRCGVPCCVLLTRLVVAGGRGRDVILSGRCKARKNVSSSKRKDIDPSACDDADQDVNNIRDKMPFQMEIEKVAMLCLDLAP